MSTSPHDQSNHVRQLIKAEIVAQGVRQTDVAAAVAKIRDTRQLSQSAISQMLNPKSSPIDPADLMALEQALNRPEGTWTRLLGYEPVGSRPVLSVRDAVESDPHLAPDERRILIRLYESLVADRDDTP